MITIKGEGFYSVKELGKIIGLSSVGVFCLLKGYRGIRCTNIKGHVYVSKGDFLKSLDPNEKSDKVMIEKITRKGGVNEKEI
ncbi:hypothetical protein ES705_21339 [subsurface metagenome]